MLPAAFSLYVALTVPASVDSVLLTSVAMLSKPFGPVMRKSDPSIELTSTAALSAKSTLINVDESAAVTGCLSASAAVGTADLVMLNELNRGVGPDPVAVASNTILIARLPAESDV